MNNTPTTKTLTLTDEQWKLLAASVEACSPTGGGSDQYTLLRSLSSQGVDHNASYELVGKLQTVAHEEYEEAHTPDAPAFDAFELPRKLTVATLIAKLQPLPQDMKVVAMSNSAESYGEDIGQVINVVPPNEELPSAVYLLIED